jgi:hypothetical protein
MQKHILAVFIVLITTVCLGAEKNRKFYTLTDPIKFTIKFLGTDGKKTDGTAAYQEYKPEFKLDGVFGFKWEDLDFKEPEQLCVGARLFKTKEQYLSLLHGKFKAMRNDTFRGNDLAFLQFTKSIDINMKVIYPVYKYKISINIGGRSYCIMKGIEIKSNVSNPICSSYFLDKNVWKISSQLSDDSETGKDILKRLKENTAKEDNTRLFVQWLKKNDINK